MLCAVILLLAAAIQLVHGGSCGTVKYAGPCSFADNGYVYIRGSVAPATSGTGNDLLTFTVTSVGTTVLTTAVTPIFGFDCLPTASGSTAIDSRDFDPASVTCAANSPLSVGIPLRPEQPYSIPGNWIIGLKACSATVCAFDLSASLLQGTCGQTATDWQIMTSEQVKSLKVCSGASLSPLSALLLSLALAAFSTVNSA